MNFFHLEYFIVLAETLNYTKASEKLNITQPNLSKAIVNIEKQIDCKLFKRNKRDVHLTKAGEVFYEEVKKTIKCYDNAVKKAREADKGMFVTLKIGFLGTAVVRLLPTILNEFYAKNPKVDVELVDYTYSPLVSALHQKEIDFAILPNNELSNNIKVKKRPLHADDMCVVVHKSHPFAKMDYVSINDLKDERFVHMHPKASLRDCNLINSICSDAGFIPNTVYEANSLFNMLMMVECQTGVTILARHMHHFATEHVKFVKIQEYTNFFDLICAWHDEANPAIDKFLETLDYIFPLE